MQAPNVLFVVWDACRLDAASQYASTLRDLATDNLWFENAITPAGYSLPAHASLFTGVYPHEHGIYSPEHSFDDQPLLRALGDRGYLRYGVSANGFASPMYGFDRGFDRFANTQGQMIYPDGLDVHAFAGRSRTDRGQVDVDSFDHGSLAREILTHAHPLRSLVNVLSAGLTELVRAYPSLERIPHPRFSRISEFGYRPRRNTRAVEGLLDEAMAQDRPFFLFVNYMDAHHPYAPGTPLQEEYCGRTYSQGELQRLAELTHPLDFLERSREGSALDEPTREQIQCLYAGEVATVDAHLAKLLQALEDRGLRDETLIVVTADHGENLGETDDLGETRIGHVLSASDALLRVPLVLAHRNLEGRVVNNTVSVKDLFEVVLNPEPLLASKGSDLGGLEADGPVAAEVPAYLNQPLWERYPSLRDLLARSLVAAYFDDWKVVATSAGDVRAFHDGTEQASDAAPDRLREVANRHLEALPNDAVTGSELSDQAVSHLKALGYI